MKKITFSKIIGENGVFVDGDWVESKDQDLNGDVRLIQLADIGDGYFVNKSNRFLTSAKAKELKCTFLKEGDVLIARMPDPIGRACIFPKLEMPCVTVVDVCIVRPNPELVDPEWLKYFINSSEFRDQINQFVTGTTRKRISRGNLEKIEFELPSLEEQKRIVRALDAADALRQKRKQAIALLDDYLKAVFLEMFGDPVENPKGWEVKTIEQIAKKEKYSIKRGPFGGALKKDIFVEDGYLVYEQFHALNNDFSMARYFVDDRKFEELKAFEVKAGDIIISCSGVYLGKLAIVPDGCRKGIINQALLKVTLDQTKMNNLLFMFIFTNENFKNKFFGQKIGSGIPNFPPMTDFKKFAFICPPIEHQNKFVEIALKTEKLKQAMLTQSYELGVNFRALMQCAFNNNY